MTYEEALELREIKRGCTFRRLAELYYPKDHELHGRQYAGVDLCMEALRALNIEFNGTITIYVPVEKYSSPKFDAENKSYLGDFYWWE